MSAKVIQVIQTDLTSRGSGKDMSSPMRGVTQYWSLDGEMLAEVDPCAGSDIAKAVLAERARCTAAVEWFLNVEKFTARDVLKRLDEAPTKNWEKGSLP